MFNKRYAIGAPGGRVRFVSCREEDLALNVQEDEISLETEETGLFSFDEEGALVAFVPDFSEAKAVKWSQLKEERELRLATAITSFGTFDSDNVAKTNINGIVTSILTLQSLGQTPPDVAFRMTDNSTEIFTPAEFIQASLEVSAYLGAVYERSWALKAFLDASCDVAAIQSLEWDSDLD